MPRVISNCASAYVIHTSGPIHAACHRLLPSEIRLSETMNSTAPSGAHLDRFANDATTASPSSIAAM
jgi:hypothetical protein